MEKKDLKKTLTSLVLVLIILVSLAAASTNTSNDVLSQVNSILKKVEEIRGLTFKEHPEIVVLTREEARERFRPGRPDIERMRLEEDVYKMSLLLPPNYPYVHEKVEQSVGWIAVTIGNTIYIIAENFLSDPDTARRVIAHESVHVLQKQWFNAPYGGPTLDTTKAIQAAIEGDADLVADIYCNETGIPIHKITDLYTRDPVTALGIFPYVFGDRFVAYLYRTGGWRLVNEMYSYLPNTTKVVMFPSLYLQNWTPIDVRADVERLVPKNATIRYSDRMGAYYVFLIYWGHNATREKGMEMAKGWYGDWLIMGDVNGTNGTERFLVWEVLFDTPEHATTFGNFLERIAKNDDYATFTVKTSEQRVTLLAKKTLSEGKTDESEGEVEVLNLWKDI